MANKAISELPQALNVNNQDLFVLEQSGIAKKLTAETFITEQGIIDALAEALDGHGGIASVTLSSVSGRIRTYLITFTDGTTTTFQVLDGTSISRIEKTSTAGLVDTYTVFMTDGTTSFFQVRNGQDGSATWDQINSKAPVITDTLTGAIVNFHDGADDIPVADLVVNIEPVQSGSGDPSPDNVRPITGWTGCNVTRMGKNLFNYDAWKGVQVSNGTAVFENNGVTLTATGNDAYTRYENSAFPVGARIPVKEGETITLSWEETTNASGSVYIFPNGGTTGLVTGSNAFVKQVSYTPTEGITYVSFRFGVATSGTTISYKNIMVRPASLADSTYEPYITPSTASLSWQTEAGTVYGGSLDVTTGVLTVDRAYGQVTAEYLSELSSSYIGYLSSTTIFSGSPCIWVRNLFYNNGAKSRTAGGIKAACNAFAISFNNTNFHSTQNRCAFKIDGVTIDSVESFISAVQNLESNGSGLFIAYELASPLTYQLTPQEIKTLLGTNNIFSDCSSVEVKYRADTELYIEKDQLRQDNNLTYVESSSSASRAYAANDLFVNRDGLLCKVTATVSSGGTLVEGTNYTILSGNGGLGAEVTSVLNGKEDAGWLTGMGFSRTDVSGSGNVTIRDYTIFLAKLITVSGATIQSLVNAHYKVTFYLKNSNGGSFSLSGNCAGNTYNLSADSSGLVSGTYEGDVSANGTIYNGLVGGSVGSGSIFAATVLVKF